MDEETFWQAVLARDARADGLFVYAVRTTGVYCRPSCPARRPRRDHVLFFSQPAAAEQAHFRPCRRCRPDGAARSAGQVELVQRVCQYIETHLDSPLTLAVLSTQAHLSPHHLQRTFKQITGVTPRQYAEACRLQQFKARLKEDINVTNAMYDAGYHSSSRVYERTPAQIGMTPATYQRGGQAQQIRYTVIDCRLGRMLIAATDRGICAIKLGDTDDTLVALLAEEYPAASIQRDDEQLRQWAALLTRHLDGQQPHLDLPLDVQATAFQWRVWEVLRAIPYGSTRSYREIAHAIGQPSAVRAVARACATNPVALAVPCHRAVRQDGSLGGYRWGLERKRALLEQEAEQADTKPAG